jgi:hypothetical protein
MASADELIRSLEIDMNDLDTVAEKLRVEDLKTIERPLSPYNSFMKSTIKYVKYRSIVNNIQLSHKDAFKVSAILWKTSSNNPKNNPNAQ